MAVYPDKIAVIDGDRRYSYAEFGEHMLKETNKWQRVVKEEGIKAE